MLLNDKRVKEEESKRIIFCIRRKISLSGNNCCIKKSNVRTIMLIFNMLNKRKYHSKIIFRIIANIKHIFNFGSPPSLDPDWVRILKSIGSPINTYTCTSHSCIQSIWKNILALYFSIILLIIIIFNYLLQSSTLT